MLKSKGAMLGVAAALVVAVLTVASLAVTTTSGAGTDDTDNTPAPTVVAQPTSAPSTPPQAPIEAPADTTADPTGGQQGAGTGPGELPDAGYGTADNGGSTSLIFGLAGIVLMAGSGLMFAASKAGSRKS